MEREIYKGLVDGRFRQEEIWDFHDSLDNQALTWLVRFMLLRMEGQYESVNSNNENRYEDFLERVQLIAKWKDRDTQEEATRENVVPFSATKKITKKEER